MSGPSPSNGACDPESTDYVEGDYPYHYYHFWTRLYVKTERGASERDEKGRCIRMGWDQQQVLGNWWHALVDEMFTEAAQRGAAYRGKASDWVGHASATAQSMPLPLRRAGDPCADPDPKHRPTYRGGSDTPLPQLSQEHIESLPSAEVRGARDGVPRWHDKQLWVTHELELENYRMQHRTPEHHDNETQRVERAERVLEKETSAVAEWLDHKTGRLVYSPLNTPYGTLEELTAELDECKRRKDALVNERKRVWGLLRSKKPTGGQRVVPVGSASILPWLLLHPAHRSPTFRWYMRTVGGPVVSYSLQDELEELYGSTKNAFVTVDLRDVDRRNGLLQARARERAQAADAEGSSSAEGVDPSKRARQTPPGGGDVLDANTWDALRLRSLWRATALLHDVGVKMAHIAGQAPPAENLSAPAESFPFYVSPNPETPAYYSGDKAPQYRFGPSAEADPNRHELLRYISGCPLQDLEFTAEWQKVNSPPPDEDRPRVPVTMLVRARAPLFETLYAEPYSQLDAHKIGWHHIEARADAVGTCNWADALRCEAARLAQRLVDDAQDHKLQTSTLLMMALGVADADADAELNALQNGAEKDQWAAAFAILAEFFKRGVAEAMRATSDSSERYAHAPPAQRQSYRLDVNPAENMTEALEAGRVLEAAGISNAADVLDGIETAADKLAYVQDKLRALPASRNVDSDAMRELAQLKTACRVLAARTEIDDLGGTDQHPPYLAATAAANGVPQSVFDKQEEAMLAPFFRGANSEAIFSVRHFAIGARFGSQGPLKPLRAMAADMAKLVFGTEIGSTGVSRKWQATLAKRTEERADGVHVFDDGTAKGQTGPPAFHFLDSEDEPVNEEQVRAEYLLRLQTEDPEAYRALTDEHRTALANRFVGNATFLRNYYGSINTFMRPDARRWPTLDLEAHGRIDAAVDALASKLLAKQRFASALQSAREAWALDTAIRAVDAKGPAGFDLLEAATAPPDTYPVNGQEVQLWVPGYDAEDYRSPESRQTVVDVTAAAVMVANGGLKKRVSALTVASELHDALRLDLMTNPGSVSDVVMRNAESDVEMASRAVAAAQEHATSVAVAALEAVGNGMAPRLAFLFANGTPQHTEGQWQDFREADTESKQNDELDLRMTSMAPFVFLKQRECEMQLVYTTQNKALADTRTSAHWENGASVLKFKVGGVELPDALKHVRKPSLLRTREEEEARLQAQRGWASAVDCPEGEVPTPEGPEGEPELWTDAAAPHMLDVPTNARYAFGIVASLDDNSGRLLAEMQMPGDRLSVTDWISWLGQTLSRNPRPEEDAKWLEALAAAGDRKLAAVLFRSSVCTCDTEAVGQNDASWRQYPELAFAKELTSPVAVGAAIDAARKIIKRRYVPNAWARRVVVEPDEGAVGTGRCVITPERYQHPAILVQNEHWQMNDSRGYSRVENGKPALDFAYVRDRYDAFMGRLGSLQENTEGDDADEGLVYGTREYQNQGYMKTNALLKLGPFKESGNVAPSSRSALGDFWAKIQVSGLYAATHPAGNRYAHHVVRGGEPVRDGVRRYSETHKFYTCSLYTLMYHLYENPDCVGVGTPGKNPYAETYEQWTANHTLAMAYLCNVYKGKKASELSEGTEQIEFGADGNPDAFAKRAEAHALIAGAAPMPYVDAERAAKSPLFVMHKLLKAVYFAPRLEREIQVARGDGGFDLFCDGMTFADHVNANMLKKGGPFQATNLRVGQRFVAQGFTSTSMVAPFAYLIKQPEEEPEDLEQLYQQDPKNSGLANVFFDTTSRGGKKIPCCLHLFTLAKGMPILPMFLHGDGSRPWLDKEYEDEAEILLPPNCEMEFLGTTFVHRHHPTEYGYMDLTTLHARPDNVNGAPVSVMDEADWRMDERVIAYCWFVRYRGVPRDALHPTDDADAGDYTDDEDLDWGIGTASPRAHLRKHLHYKDAEHMKRFQERYGTLNEQKVFDGVKWPD